MPAPEQAALFYRNACVGHVQHDVGSGWYLWIPGPNSPAGNLERRWRSPHALRRAVLAACEAAQGREAAR